MADMAAEASAATPGTDFRARYLALSGLVARMCDLVEGEGAMPTRQAAIRELAGLARAEIGQGTARIAVVS